MAPLPKGFSLQAHPVKAALSEGRTEDAKRVVVDILRSGRADEAVQLLAAEMISPLKGKGRGRPKALPHHWLDIGEEFHHLRDSGVSYENALAQLEKKFGYSEGHVRNCIREYDEVVAAQAEATAEYYE